MLDDPESFLHDRHALAVPKQILRRLPRDMAVFVFSLIDRHGLLFRVADRLVPAGYHANRYVILLDKSHYWIVKSGGSGAFKGWLKLTNRSFSGSKR